MNPEQTGISAEQQYRPASKEALQMGIGVAPPLASNHQSVSAQEGLAVGKNQRKELSQQWRYFLSSEPFQRALDAGFILGSCVAAFSARKPVNRVAIRIGFHWIMGFSVGVMGMQLAYVSTDSLNAKKLKAKDEAMFQQQRQQFLKEVKER